jgi:hypothetical protein
MGGLSTVTFYPSLKKPRAPSGHFGVAAAIVVWRKRSAGSLIALDWAIDLAGLPANHDITARRTGVLCDGFFAYEDSQRFSWNDSARLHLHKS